jgi:hypothetical protein
MIAALEPYANNPIAASGPWWPKKENAHKDEEET